MDATKTPLSYGVRQAIRDSPKTTYEIGKLTGVSPQNLYRFLDESHPRALSQKSLDSLCVYLKLKLTYRGDSLLSGQGKDYRIVFDDSKRVVPIDTLINGPADDPLSVRLGRAVKLHRKDLKEIATALDVSLAQLYRFLDGSRGLSQARLDSLCALLRLFVEAPPMHIPPFRSGLMPTTKRRIYIPEARPGPAVNGGAEGRGAPPVHPTTLYVPSSEEPDAQS